MRLFIQAIPIFLIFVGLISCEDKKTNGAGPAANRQQGPLTLEGFIVEEQFVSDKVEAPGSLLPAEETQIRAEVSGRVVRLNIDEGDLVKKDQVLVKLFDEELQAQLRKLEVQLQIARKTEERQRELLQISGISQQEYDLTALQVENLKADIQSTRIAVSKTEIRAPYQGRVGLRNISLGTYVSPSEVITTLRQVDQLKLEFAVPEKYSREITRGAKIHFRVDGGTSNHTATVIATEGGVDQATRTLRVRALVNATHPELVPGIFARVILQLGQSGKALMIPTQAVIPQARNKQVVIFRKDSAHFTVVQTGIRDSVYVQITDGLKAGDTVITTGLMAIRPNAKIKLRRLNRYQKN